VNRERGVAILLVEHDLDLVRRVTQRLACFDLGALIADGPPDAVLADPIVRRAYVGDVDPDIAAEAASSAGADSDGDGVTP
jgi:branched-chain amino acid transport system ATP-binding protein